MNTTWFTFNGSLLTGIGLLTVIVIIGAAAPWLAPHDPLQIDLLNRLAAPSLEYPFGTDHLGRCVLSRTMYGIRTTVTVACMIMVFTVCISLPIGLFIGYLRGRTDRILMRAVDGMLAIPDMVITVAAVGILGPSLTNMVAAVIMVRWATYVRFIRTLVQKACREDYILYARLSGNSHFRIMRRYIFPKIVSPLAAFGAWDMGRVVLMIAGLSFLGLGAQPPTPEWGVMLHDATAYFQLAPHVMLFPGLAIMLFVWACQLMGDRSERGAA